MICDRESKKVTVNDAISFVLNLKNGDKCGGFG